MAAEYPFRKIVGVELAPNVYQVGLTNIRTFRSARQRCLDLELIEGDAVDVELPTGHTLFFFYAPFHGPVMYQVLENIRQSMAEDERDVIVIWIDEDVEDSLTNRVAERIASWGTMEPLQIDVPADDPEARLPIIGTFWGSRPKRH